MLSVPIHVREVAGYENRILKQPRNIPGIVNIDGER